MRKWKHYIAVIRDDEYKFVTNTTGHNTALWEEGKTARAFPESLAKDIADGLCMNMIPAFVIKAPEFITFKNEPERSKMLLGSAVNWFFAEMPEPKKHLRDIGLRDDEIEHYREADYDTV